eukprot:TRINITY_DN27560_c0_g1_i1.p1 TRINITY_DN27560_c0_g1~~TRINITY_DN27560_c0_g1_i1.p1  ORF type:complete len:360 (+),score=91.47 TRINITY_DN27560_c0_g1_i1:86-1081(+)
MCAAGIPLSRLLTGLARAGGPDGYLGRNADAQVDAVWAAEADAELAADLAQQLSRSSFAVVDCSPPQSSSPEFLDFVSAFPEAYEAWGAWLDTQAADDMGASEDADPDPGTANMGRGLHRGFTGWTHGVLAGCGGVVAQEPGYYRQPLRQAFHVFTEDADACQWPRDPRLRGLLCAVQRRLEALTVLLLRLLAAAFPEAAGALRRACGCRFLSVLDVFRYRADGGTEGGALAMQPHTDPGLLTLIPCATAPALEVADAAAPDTWVEVERGCPPLGRICVLCCDDLQRMTGGALPAALHRVRRPAAPRTSLAYELRQFSLRASRGRWSAAAR